MKALLPSLFSSAALLLAATGFLSTPAAGSSVMECHLDAEGHFVVSATVPAGNHYAALEAMLPAQSTAWRTMLVAPIDGREATVEFRLPRNAQPRMLARVTIGDGNTPGAELSDASLYTVTYAADSPDESAKLTLLTNAGAKLREWKALSRAQRQANLVTWAKTQKYVTTAVIAPDTDSVSIETNDGDVLLVMNRPKPTAEQLDIDFPNGASAPDPMPESAAAPVQGFNGLAAGGDKGLPESPKAICSFSLEPSFPNSAPTIAGWLNGKGYTAQIFSSTTIEQVEGWFAGGPVGVLFWHAHGVSYTYQGQEYHAISLNQTATKELSEGTYAAMRKAGEIKLAIDDVMPAPVYTITRKFIRAHMQFAPHSLVVMDSCNGSDPELAAAFLDAGAGGYASWNKESGPQSGTPIERLFDRLLGTNAKAPISTPGERPFSLTDIRSWMDKKGYDFDPTFQGGRRALLKFSLSATAPAHILRPTIKQVQLSISDDNAHSRYLLLGDFGADPGPANRVITWGGKDVAVESWSQDDGIVIIPPAALPVGDFQVTLRDHFSNTVPMTEWNVPFTYVFKAQGTQQYAILANMKMRADVHGFRDLPEDPVKYQPVPFQNYKDLTGALTASGSYTSPGPFPSIETWSGARGLISYDLGGTGPQNNALICSGLIDPATGKTISFGVSCSSSLDYSLDGGPSHPISCGYDSMTSYMMKLSFSPGSGWNLNGDSFNGNPAGTGLGGVSAKMSWPTTTPVDPPTANTVR